MSNFETGHVKFFDEVKGYGFVVDEKGKDVFVHSTTCKENKVVLCGGDKVEFTRELGKNGGYKVSSIKKG